MGERCALLASFEMRATAPPKVIRPSSSALKESSPMPPAQPLSLCRPAVQPFAVLPFSMAGLFSRFQGGRQSVSRRRSCGWNPNPSRLKIEIGAYNAGLTCARY